MKLRRIKATKTVKDIIPDKGKLMIPSIRFESTFNSEIQIQTDELTTCVIYGKEFEYKDVMWPLNKTTQWAWNLRYPVESLGLCDSDQDRCLRIFELKKELQEFASLVLRNGGIPEACYGIPMADGLMEIVDGSCRCAIMKLGNGLITIPPDHKTLASFAKKFRAELAVIQKQTGKDKPFPDMLPVRILPKADPFTVKASIAFKHAAGSNQWQPEGKALMAYDMLREDTNMPDTIKSEKDLRKLWDKMSKLDDKNMQELLRNIGVVVKQSRIDRVRLLIMAMAATLFFQKKYKSSDRPRIWDHFRRFYNMKPLRDLSEGMTTRLRMKNESDPRYNKFVEIARVPDLEENFMVWLANDQIEDTVDIQHLPHVLSHQKSRQILLDKGKLTAAVKEYNQFCKVTEASSLLADMDIILENIGNLTKRQIQEIKVDKRKIPEELRSVLALLI